MSNPWIDGSFAEDSTYRADARSEDTAELDVRPDLPEADLRDKLMTHSIFERK